MQMATRIICCKFWSNTWVFTSNWLHWNIILQHKWHFSQNSRYFSQMFLIQTLNVVQTGPGKHDRTEMHWTPNASLLIIQSVGDKRDSLKSDEHVVKVSQCWKCQKDNTERLSPSLLSDPVKPQLSGVNSSGKLGRDEEIPCRISNTDWQIPWNVRKTLLRSGA